MGFLTAIHCSDNLRSCTETHYKASLIKVLDIILMDAVFLNSLMHSCKPLFYNPWILLLCTLVCNPPVISCAKGWMAFNKLICLVDTNGCGRILCTLME
jgi:sorbitol-specific phosphotransferase system component IIBC